MLICNSTNTINVLSSYAFPVDDPPSRMSEASFHSSGREIITKEE